MSALPLSLLRELQTAPPDEAWAALLAHTWSACAAPLEQPAAAKASSEITRRDSVLDAADLFLSSAAWDLWRSFPAAVERTSEALVGWWSARAASRAVLVLDALSLREAPWILMGAARHGYTIHQARPTAAELPGDTAPFAKALGIAGRSALAVHNGGSGLRLAGAVTDTTNVPWADCATSIKPAQDVVLWHHWPDERLHQLAVPGHGLNALAREASEELGSDAFWQLVHRLSTGRRLVITGDHGYAASGQFADADPGQTKFLKERFKSSRWADLGDLEDAAPGTWAPPLDLPLPSKHAKGTYVLGRRKWKSAGGYPTLTHGGLTLLEMLVPFIELSRPGGA